MVIRACREDDVDSVRQLVSQCKPVGLYSAYCYWVTFRNLGNSCFVLEDEGKPIGYVSGLRSTINPDVFFLWQLGVLEEYRTKGCGSLLINKIIEVAREQGCTSLQFTILPGNDLSYRAFNSFANRNSYEMREVGKLDYIDTLSGIKLEDPIFELPFCHDASE